MSRIEVFSEPNHGIRNYGQPPCSPSLILKSSGMWGALWVIDAPCSTIESIEIHNRPYRSQPSNPFITILRIWGVPRNFTAFFSNLVHKETTVGSRTKLRNTTAVEPAWHLERKENSWKSKKQETF